MSASSDVVLKLEDVDLSFGGIKALDQISCEVRRGEIYGIIGPNGAGKTSTLNCISGFYRPQNGQIYFEGRPITRLRPDRDSPPRDQPDLPEYPALHRPDRGRQPHGGPAFLLQGFVA